MFAKHLSPKICYRGLAHSGPWLGGLCAVLMVIGLLGALWLAPSDYQQGDAFRIIYVHVPSAFLSMGVYTLMAVMAAIGLIWRVKVAFAWAIASAPTGACFTALALITGAIWGKPMWGTAWVWDARLTSELILLFLYLGYLGLYRAIPHQAMADKASSILLLVGVINIPIIHFSVTWWYTLHQGPTLSRFAKPAMETSMLIPLLIMIAAFGCYYLWVTTIACRREILQRERHAQWLSEGLHRD